MVVPTAVGASSKLGDPGALDFAGVVALSKQTGTGERSRDRAGIHPPSSAQRYCVSTGTILRGETGEIIDGSNATPRAVGNERGKCAGGIALVRQAMTRRITADSLSSKTADAIFTARLGSENETRFLPGPGPKGNAMVELRQ